VSKQTSNAATVARATAEQAVTTEEIARGMADMRKKMREVATVTASQAKRAAAVAVDVKDVGAKITQIARADAEQAGAMSALSAAMTEGRSETEGQS